MVLGSDGLADFTSIASITTQRARAMTDWTLCGWRVRSDFPLHETLPWAGPEDHPVDVTVRFGDVPLRLTDPIRTEAASELGADGEFLLSMRNVGRYLTRNGNEVVVTPLCPLDQPDLRLFIENFSISTLALQRGLLAMHGAVVRVAGKTIAIFGTSGQGKSTLAAILAQRGHRFMSEDVCVLDFETGNGVAPMVIPTIPNIRLWEDALEHLNIKPSEVIPSRKGLKKYHVRRPRWFHDRPERLDAIIILSKARPPTELEGLHRLRGIGPLQTLCEFVNKPMLAEMMGLQSKTVDMAMHYVSAGLVFNLGATRDKTRLSASASAVENLAASLDA